MPGIVAAVLRLEEETPSLVQGEYLAGLCGGAGGEEHECRYVSFHCRGWFWCLVAKIIQRRLKIKFSVAGAVSVRGGASAVGCPALRGTNACRGPVSVYFAAGWLYAAAGRLGRAHGWSGPGREPCGVCGVSRAMPERGVPEEFRGTSGHKKSGRPRLFGLPQAGVLLESGSCYQKTIGMCDPCFGELVSRIPGTVPKDGAGYCGKGS